MPPEIAALGPVDLVAAPLDHEHVLDRLLLTGAVAVGEGQVDRGLQGRHLSLAPSPVGGDDELGARVVDARAQAVGREPAEDDGVHGADSRDGEHRGDGLGDHREVQRDAVPSLDTELGEDVRQALHLVGQLGVGDVALVAGLSLPAQSDAIAVARFDVPVEAVVRDVELTVGEPLRERGVRPVEHLSEGAVPVELTGLLGPETLAVRCGALVEIAVGDGLGGEVGRRREPAGLVEEVVDLAAHRGAPSRSRTRAPARGVLTVVTLSTPSCTGYLR
ncbi:hypothetical protein QE454_001795 [Microbacterium sp. SORGH_AS454]|nr:hypothetical protein [Microbacterium sp. SORGH_AS_0454]